ncbi:putative disease resistance protein RGA3 isoform X2 [Brachypodium distachyon]|uniref:putative disease resistance protein RGA3 isoform X2 n=1 Tax=Brachypodium distachyon TaxID=15368 RepID=UPI00071D5BFD|nr:putative disease resistance protein RGA3 isoform X2 [Brachypodium distachyon]|eukprot:XP_014754554.1 putative disease resistance protein RGA3 isoform X2 [Brachypodium distachyon]
MAKKMEKMRVDLEVITDQHKKFKLMADTNANELKVVDIRETSSMMEAQIIIGRTAEREKLLASLSESVTGEMTILPIYGIGGLGKTTLAKMIYNSNQFKEYSQVWVYVSQTFDLKKIGNSVISQLSEKESQYTGAQMIQSSLSKLLADKKILIVLDDLWEDMESHLDNLKAMLRVGKGSKVVVIVTTRDEHIAKKMSTIEPHKLAPLTDDMCWSIIKQKSDFESRDDNKELEQIGMEIAMKCKGVALAAQSLGHMLHSVTFGEWESVRNSHIWDVSTSEEAPSTHVLASLSLSYSVMPPYLKLCFSYCAIFPKGCKIVKDDLIHQWVSLGFVEPPDVFSSWLLGERYIRQLLGLSFLQNSKSPSTTEVYLEDNKLLTMHDLVHDLARSVLADEFFVSSKQANAKGSLCHFALISDCSKALESSKIRALRFVDCGETVLQNAAFSSAKSLRVLDLRECVIHRIPDSIGQLKQLRYLNAPRVQHATIPDSITKLLKLTYLKLNKSPTVLALPESIGDIEGLMYLDLSGCSGIEKLPASLGRLKKLVHLDLSNCTRVGGVSVFLENLTELQYLNLSHCPNIGPLSEALGGLSELQYLNLSFSSYLVGCQEAEVLGTFSKLEYLNLSSRYCKLQKLPEALGRCVKLKYLNLRGLICMEELPVSFRNLNNLVHLDLKDCRRVIVLPETLGGLTKLQYLNLSWASNNYERSLIGLPNVMGNLTELRYLNLSGFLNSVFETDWNGEIDSFMDRISTLSNLEHLDLSGNSSIRSIPASFCNLRKVHTMDFSYCFGLYKLPECIGTMDSLTLYLKGCPLSDQPHLSGSLVTLPCFVVHAGEGESSSNLVLLQHINPEELEITELENVKSPEEAHCINLTGKQSMEELELRWTEDAQRFVDDKMLLEKLVPPSTVKKFMIQGYNNVSLPAWLMDITHYLPYLFRLEMCDMPNCNVLPPVSQLRNLVWLVLSGMESLEDWNTSYSSGEEHVIDKLEIHNCPKLRMDLAQPRAICLKISKSDNVLSSWGEYMTHTGASSSYSSVTTELVVSCCKVPLYNWSLLHHLTGLTDLSISCCSDLTSSPEIIQHLCSVESLLLEDNDQDELPEWLGELTSLQKLEIKKYTGLIELHENMRQLKKLQTLKVCNCNSMVSLPLWLGELISLKELTFWSCYCIRSLPESLQQLTNLQELYIFCCFELEHLVESEENQKEFTDMKERVCILPTSLTKLQIMGCEGISSLPEGIQQLTNLQELHIINCCELVKWCRSEENEMKLAHIEKKVII